MGNRKEPEKALASSKYKVVNVEKRNMQLNIIPKIISELKENLRYSKVRLPLELKLRVAEVILNIMASKEKHFGLFIVVGWQTKWNIYTDISDSDQDIFA